MPTHGVHTLVAHDGLAGMHGVSIYCRYCGLVKTRETPSCRYQRHARQRIEWVASIEEKRIIDWMRVVLVKNDVAVPAVQPCRYVVP